MGIRKTMMASHTDIGCSRRRARHPCLTLLWPKVESVDPTAREEIQTVGDYLTLDAFRIASESRLRPIFCEPEPDIS
jgi:hypothetical protein